MVFLFSFFFSFLALLLPEHGGMVSRGAVSKLSSRCTLFGDRWSQREFAQLRNVVAEMCKHFVEGA